MATTTFSTNGSGSSSYYALDVVVSGIATGSTTAIALEVDFSCSDHEQTACDVSDGNFSYYGLWADYDLSGSGSRTYTHNISSLPPSPNQTYTFEVYGSGGNGLTVTQVRVIVTHGSSGSNYALALDDAQAATQAQGVNVTATSGSSSTTATGANIASGGQVEGGSVILGSGAAGGSPLSPSGIGSEVGWWCPSIGGIDPDQQNLASSIHDLVGIGITSLDFAADNSEGGSLCVISRYREFVKGFKVDGPILLDAGLQIDDFSISGWAFTSWPTSKQYLFASVDSLGRGWKLQIGNSAVQLHSSSRTIPFETVTSLEPNVWFHFAATVSWNRKTIKMYLNGEMESETTVSSALISASDDLYVEANPNYQWQSLQGRWDDFRIFNEEISANDVFHLASSRGVLGPAGAWQIQVDSVEIQSAVDLAGVASSGAKDILGGVYAWYSSTIDQNVLTPIEDLAGNNRDQSITGSLSILGDTQRNGTHAYDFDSGFESEHDLGGYFNAPSYVTDGFTVCGWIKFSEDATDSYPFGFKRYHDATRSTFDSMIVGFYRDDEDEAPSFRMSVARKKTNTTASTLYPLAPNNNGYLHPDTWYHIALTGALRQHLYLDGVYVGGPTNGLWASGATQIDSLWLGCHGECLTDDIRYYPRELGPAELSLLARSRGYGAQPKILPIEKIESPTEARSFAFALPVQSIESLSRVHCDTPCVQVMNGLQARSGDPEAKEHFWYYPEYNDPNGYDATIYRQDRLLLNDQSGNHEAGHIHGGCWGMWGNFHPDSATEGISNLRYLGFNALGVGAGQFENSGQYYVDTRNRFFDRHYGSITIWARLYVPDLLYEWQTRRQSQGYAVMGSGQSGINNGEGWRFKIDANLKPSLEVDFTHVYRDPRYALYMNRYLTERITISIESDNIPNGADPLSNLGHDRITSVGFTINKTTGYAQLYVSGNTSNLGPHIYTKNIYAGKTTEQIAAIRRSYIDVRQNTHLGAWGNYNQMQSIGNPANFDGIIVDARGYSLALTTQEMESLVTSGKGPQAACDASDPNIAIGVHAKSIESGARVSAFELGPKPLFIDSVESQSGADEFYLLPLQVPVNNADAVSESQPVALGGSLEFIVESLQVMSLVNGLFTMSTDRKIWPYFGFPENTEPSQLLNVRVHTESQSIGISLAVDLPLVESIDCVSEAEEVFIPLTAGQKLAKPRNVECLTECSQPIVSRVSEADAYLIYCPSRSYDYVDTDSMPDLSGTHSPQSASNPDIAWAHIEGEWAIDMRQTVKDPTISEELTNAVEITPDRSESIDNFGMIDFASLNDRPLSVSMHFRFNEWPQQDGYNSQNPLSSLGLYNFVYPESFVQTSQEYFDDMRAGVRVYIARDTMANGTVDFRIISEVLYYNRVWKWSRMYSTALTTLELSASQFHHVVTTYDGVSSATHKVYLNGQDVTASGSEINASATNNGYATHSQSATGQNIGDFTHPPTLRKAFIGRTCGRPQNRYISNAYIGSSDNSYAVYTRGESPDYWDDFRFFQKELAPSEITRLGVRGVDLPARWTIPVSSVEVSSVVWSEFAPVSVALVARSIESPAEVDELFTVGSNYLIDTDDSHAATEAESLDMIRHKGCVADSIDSVTQCSSFDVLAEKAVTGSNVRSKSEASRLFVSKTSVLNIKSIEMEAVVFDIHLSGEGVILVNNATSASQASESNVTRIFPANPESVQSSTVAESISIDAGLGLDSRGSQAVSECEEPSLTVHAPLYAVGSQSETEVEDLFFLTDKTLLVSSVKSFSECGETLVAIRTSLSTTRDVQSITECEAITLQLAAIVNTDSVNSISEVSDATLSFVLGVDAEDVDSGSESESPYVSVSPLRATSVDCATEVKGFTLPDLSNIKTGPPRLFLESDLIIGDY